MGHHPPHTPHAFLSYSERGHFGAGTNMRHVQIDPDWTESDICHAIHDGPKQGMVPNEHFGGSQTQENIPSGRVASRRHDL